MSRTWLNVGEGLETGEQGGHVCIPNECPTQVAVMITNVLFWYVVDRPNITLDDTYQDSCIVFVLHNVFFVPFQVKNGPCREQRIIDA